MNIEDLGPLMAFDTETSGVNVWEDRIVSACVVEFWPGKRPSATSWLVATDVEIPAEATAVHGITTAYAQEHGRDPAQVLYELTGRLALWMGRRLPVVAMNAAFDFTMLEAENTRYHLPTLAERLAPKPIGPIIDPFVMDKKVDKWRKGGRKLVDLCATYGVPLVAAHTAESDAASAVRLARAIIAKHPDAFRGMTIGGLHQAQRQWRREQQDSLRAYFDRQGTAHDGMDPGWPVMSPPPVPVAPPQEALHG